MGMLESGNLGDFDSLHSSAKDLTSEPSTLLDSSFAAYSVSDVSAK